MALPTPIELATMDYVYLGGPFVSVTTKTTTLTASMDYVYLGLPFVVNDYVAAAGGTARSWGFIFG